MKKYLEKVKVRIFLFFSNRVRAGARTWDRGRNMGQWDRCREGAVYFMKVVDIRCLRHRRSIWRMQNRRSQFFFNIQCICQNASQNVSTFPQSLPNWAQRDHLGSIMAYLSRNLLPTWPMLSPTAPQLLWKSHPKSRHWSPKHPKTLQDASIRRFSSIFNPFQTTPDLDFRSILKLFELFTETYASIPRFSSISNHSRPLQTAIFDQF